MDTKITPEEGRLDALIASGGGGADAILERGKLRWRRGDRAGAISDYERAAAIDPDGPAQALLEHTRGIMDFFNPDLYNP